jgi:hypothetical protein
MMLCQTAAYGIYPLEARIDGVIAVLGEAGLRTEDICVLLAPAHPIAEAVRDARVSSYDTTSGREVSEVLHWLSRFGAVIIPEVGFFVSSRVFLGAVLAPDTTKPGSTHLETLLGLGIPEPEASRYAERLTHDAVMLFVCCDGMPKSEWTRQVLRQTGAEEACCLGDVWERNESEGLRASV